MRNKKFFKKPARRIARGLVTASLLVGMCAGSLVGCGGSKEAKITVFAAKSLNGVMDELIELYQKDNANIEILTNYDSSGTLMQQIEESAECDIFFSAAQTQMDELEDGGYLVDKTRTNLVNNQVCVVTYKGSNTQVTGIEDMDKASSIALADGTVPVGKYTRVALVNAGILPETDDPASISTADVSAALGNVEINECANVGFVASSVAEQSNEVGTVYCSDYMGYEDQLDIVEVVPYDLTGNVIYPIAMIKNSERSDDQTTAAEDFLEFLKCDTAKKVFEKYYFDTNI